MTLARLSETCGQSFWIALTSGSERGLVEREIDVVVLPDPACPSGRGIERSPLARRRGRVTLPKLGRAELNSWRILLLCTDVVWSMLLWRIMRLPVVSESAGQCPVGGESTFRRGRAGAATPVRPPSVAIQKFLVTYSRCGRPLVASVVVVVYEKLALGCKFLFRWKSCQ